MMPGMQQPQSQWSKPNYPQSQQYGYGYGQEPPPPPPPPQQQPPPPPQQQYGYGYHGQQQGFPTQGYTGRVY